MTYYVSMKVKSSAHYQRACALVHLLGAIVRRGGVRKGVRKGLRNGVRKGIRKGVRKGVRKFLHSI